MLRKYAETHCSRCLMLIATNAESLFWLCILCFSFVSSDARIASSRQTPSSLSSVSALTKPTLQFPTCVGSYGCMEDACAMCPAQSVIFCNFANFSCSNEAEPITCLPDAQHQNFLCPLNASAAWSWDITTPFSLGAGASACLVNNAAPGSSPWNYAVTGISAPYIYNDNLRFSVGYVPASDGDCSSFVTLGAFSCDSDGSCYGSGLGQLSSRRLLGP